MLRGSHSKSSPAAGRYFCMLATSGRVMLAAAALTGCLSGAHFAAAQEPAAALAKCAACHGMGPGAQNKNGPSLNGIAGKPVAGAVGFTYSEAFQAARASGLLWTDENLDKYLADPINFLPGSRMAWAVKDGATRAAIITYLKTLP